MPPRKVFGKRSQAQHDVFASMLSSSPDARTTEDIPTNTKVEGQLPLPTDNQRRSPRRKHAAALQPMSNNVCRGSRQQQHLVCKSSGKTRPQAARDQSKQPTPLTSDGRTFADESSARSGTTEAVVYSTKLAMAGDSRKSIPTTLTSTSKDLVCHESDPKLPQHGAKQTYIYTEHCRPLLSLFAQDLENFSDWEIQLSEHLHVTKIAEASFGEVYRLSVKASLQGLGADITNHHESVLKIIALTPPECTIPTTKRERNKIMKKVAMMSKPADVASEIRLLQRMSSIPGFTDFREMRLLRGRPSGAFVKAYKTFNSAQQANGKDPSTFPDPARKTSYSPDQLWAVIEMRDAGTDLERLVEQGRCTDVWTVWDVFWQVALALAKGEEAAEFEHRDLHLGNICIRLKGPPASAEVMADKTKKLNFNKLDVTLIDYTISRATMSVTAGVSTDVAYLDLTNDQHVFNGDSTQEYQYDIYRYMRSALFLNNPLAAFDAACLDQSRTWSQFHPQTNVIWLHFVLYTLLQQMRFGIPGELAQDVKVNRSLTKRSKELEQNLQKINALLDPKSMIVNGLSSARMLIVTALDKRWLHEDDVIGPEESIVDLADRFTGLDVKEG